MPGRRSTLLAFSRALDRELHNLQETDLDALPAFVFQQLHNRLQWEDEPIPRILEQQAGGGAGPTPSLGCGAERDPGSLPPSSGPWRGTGTWSVPAR
jgi:hypothetical protein